MEVQWRKDVDEALAEAKANDKPLLLDFSAAPQWGGCVRLEAESYADEATAAFINDNFVPFTVNIKEHGALFHRFDALWTPTVLVMDPSGVERKRIEGYLPREEFRAQVELGLARVAFMRKRWDEAERKYAEVAQRYPATTAATEAIYWRGVSHYKATSDHTGFPALAEELRRKDPDSIWTLSASIWLPEQQEQAA
jgi:hypothetical protein